jgi:hypothetical protein
LDHPLGRFFRGNPNHLSFFFCVLHFAFFFEESGADLI